MRAATKTWWCPKSTLRGRRTAARRTGKEEEICFLCVFGIQQRKCFFFENPISRFMFACCNRFVINESFSFPISYRLIFNKFVGASWSELDRFLFDNCRCFFVHSTSPHRHVDVSMFFFLFFEKSSSSGRRTNRRVVLRHATKHWTNPP